MAGHETSDDESFDMDSDSHSAARGYDDCEDMDPAESNPDDVKGETDSDEEPVTINRCVECNMFMGNGSCARQLCCKTYCGGESTTSNERVSAQPH